MTTATLEDLARRLAEATGPDFDIDMELLGLFDDKSGVPAELLYEGGPSALPFTGDLQACWTLMRAVLPGAGWTVGSSAVLEMAEATVWSRRFISKKASAPTAPLAWLKAMVAAVMAREGGG